MLTIVDTHTEKECARQIRDIEETNEQDNWLKMVLHFKRGNIFDDILKTPDMAKSKINQIVTLHNEIVMRLEKGINEQTEAVLYAFEDKDLMLLINARAQTAPHDFIHGLKKELQQKHDGLLDIQLMPLNQSDINLVHDSKAHKIAAQEWHMYETLVDTTRCQTISKIRNRREKPVVLVVEDDEFVGYQINEYLKDTAGVIFVKTAEEAIQYYVDMAPDCVLLDVHLPGRNGFDALHCIRKVDPEANIFILTGDLVSANAQKAFQMGALNFMEKPLYRDQLVSAVKEAPLYRKATAANGGNA